jgi:hypothetical protein
MEHARLHPAPQRVVWGQSVKAVPGIRAAPGAIIALAQGRCRPERTVDAMAFIAIVQAQDRGRK